MDTTLGGGGGGGGSYPLLGRYTQHILSFTEQGYCKAKLTATESTFTLGTHVINSVTFSVLLDLYIFMVMLGLMYSICASYWQGKHC